MAQNTIQTPNNHDGKHHAKQGLDGKGQTLPNLEEGGGGILDRINHRHHPPSWN